MFRAFFLSFLYNNTSPFARSEGGWGSVQKWRMDGWLAGTVLFGERVGRCGVSVRVFLIDRIGRLPITIFPKGNWTSTQRPQRWPRPSWGVTRYMKTHKRKKVYGKSDRSLFWHDAFCTVCRMSADDGSRGIRIISSIVLSCALWFSYRSTSWPYELG